MVEVVYIVSTYFYIDPNFDVYYDAFEIKPWNWQIWYIAYDK